MRPLLIHIALILLLLPLAAVSCMPVTPVREEFATAGTQGSLALALQLPDSAANYSLFFAAAETAVERPCATLKYVRATLKGVDGIDNRNFQTDYLSLADHPYVELQEIPVGNYELKVDIISAAELAVFSGAITVYVDANDTTFAEVEMAEVGGCPRPNPEAPTVFEHPDQTGCTPMVFRGGKQKFSVIKDSFTSELLTDLRENSIDVSKATDWIIREPMRLDSRRNGFALEAAWGDAVTLTSIGKTAIATHYDDSKLCFNPYDPDGKDLASDSDGVTFSLKWTLPTVSQAFAGVVIVGYEGGRNGSSRPTITSLTMADITPSADNAIILGLVTDTTTTTSSVVLPDRTHDWSIHLFLIDQGNGQSNGLNAYDSGAAWIPAQSPASAPGTAAPFLFYKRSDPSAR